MAERTWFRFYSSARENGKVMELKDREFKLWVFVLCVYSERQVMPPIKELAYKLRLTPERTTQFLERLASIGLMEQTGGSWAPHDWDSLQFESDTSAERTRRWREKRKAVTIPVTESVTRNVGVTSHVTPSETYTETETETESEPPIPPQPKNQPVERVICLDDEFARFREIAQQAGMGGSEPDWQEARQFGWRPLDFEQRLHAVRGIVTRTAAGAVDDPVLKALPVNYLRKRMWERPIRAPTPGGGIARDRGPVDLGKDWLHAGRS